MNVVMASPDRGDYYVCCVRKSDDDFCAVGKMVGISGKVSSVYEGKSFDSKKEAEKYAKKMAKVKAKMKNYERMEHDEVPDPVKKSFEVEPEMQISEQDMLDLMARCKKERYVVFKDVEGIEDRFDEGMEYLAEETEDPTILKVYDIYGEPCQCYKYRFESVKLTEEAVVMSMATGIGTDMVSAWCNG